MVNNANAVGERAGSPPRRQKRRLRIRQIQDFLAVLTCGTLADAARRLNTSQPALTKSVRALEHSIGAELFFRSPQGMKPTAFARAFEARARVIVGEIGCANREIDELLGAKRGKVVIGAGPAFLASIFPQALRQFRQDYPGIDVTIIGGLRRELAASVLRGELDYAFHSKLDWSASEDLDFETLLRDLKIHIAGGRDNPLTARRKVSLREVSAAPWVLHSLRGDLLNKLDAALAFAGLPAITPVPRCNSMLATARFIRNSDLLSIFYDFTIQEQLDQQTIKIVRVPEISWRSDFGVISRRGGMIPPAAAKLLDVVREACAEYQRELKHMRPKLKR